MPSAFSRPALPLSASTALLCALLSSVPVLQASAQSRAQQHDYAIAAGPLATALNQFVVTSGTYLAGAADLAQGRQSPGVQGRLTPAAALDALLAGTGLLAEPQNDGSFRLRATPEGGVATLAPVSVQARLNPTSEGNPGYAAAAVSLGKTPLTLREIPQSVSVITRQQMDDQNLASVSDALRTAPGITVRPDAEASFLSRGYNVEVQYDGVPGSGLNTATQFDLAMYDRLEVLRGPSGLLQGSGNPGGMVNLVRKRPGDTFAASGTVTVGAWRLRRAELDVGGPVTDDGRVRARAVLAGYDRNFHEKVADARQGTAYGVVDIDLLASTTLSLAAGYQHRKGVFNYGVPVAPGYEPPTDGFVGTDAPETRTLRETNAQIEHRFDNGWQAQAALRWRRYEALAPQNIYLSAFDPITESGVLMASIKDQEVTHTGADVSATGPVPLLGRTHLLTVGANLGREQSRWRRAPWEPIPVANVYTDHTFAPDQIPRATGRDDTRTEQSGVYGSVRLSLADPLTAVLGGRWSNYRQKTRNLEPVTTGWNPSNARADWHFTPYGGLVWDVTEDVSLYASYTSIFAPQTQQDVAGRVLDPREGWQVEVGTKGSFFDGRLNTSLGLFRIRDRNRAMRDPINVGCGGTANGACYVAAGLVQSQGVDAEISGSPAPGWEITGGYTYTATKTLRDTTTSQGLSFSTDTPRHAFKLWGVYRAQQGALAGWHAGLGVMAQSNTANGWRPGYAVVNAQLGYQVKPGIDVVLALDNVFNRTYFTQRGSTPTALTWNMYGAPRNVLLSVRARY